MSSKRRSAISYYYQKKRTKLSEDEDMPSSAKEALLVLKSLFPIEKFSAKLPPVMMKHQIYAMISNRTGVDKDLDNLKNENFIRLFKLGGEEEQFAVVLLKDYEDHLVKTSESNPTVVHFLENVIKVCPDISYNKTLLCKKFGLKEENISELIQCGVLTIRDVGCWWLAIPNAGEFVKSLISGRKALLRFLRRSKYKEMLQTELEQRKLPKDAKLSMMYYIYDIVGADLVKSISSPTGKLLRLQEYE